MAAVPPSPYKKLQRQCKAAGLPANKSAAQLTASLAAIGRDDSGGLEGDKSVKRSVGGGGGSEARCGRLDSTHELFPLAAAAGVKPPTTGCSRHARRAG